MNQKQLEAAIRRVSADPSLEPQVRWLRCAAPPGTAALGLDLSAPRPAPPSPAVQGSSAAGGMLLLLLPLRAMVSPPWRELRAGDA